MQGAAFPSSEKPWYAHFMLIAWVIRSAPMSSIRQSIQLSWHSRMTPRSVLSSSCFVHLLNTFSFQLTRSISSTRLRAYILSSSRSHRIRLSPLPHTLNATRSYTSHYSRLYQVTGSIKDTLIVRPCLLHYYSTSSLGPFLTTVNRPRPSWPPSPRISTSASPLLSRRSLPSLGPSA